MTAADIDPAKTDHHAKIRKACQSLLLASAAGAYFAATTTAIAQDVAAGHVNRLDAFIRYAYLVWFVGYFFAVRFRVETVGIAQNWGDVIFDIFSAILSLAALAFLSYTPTAGQFMLTAPAYGALNGAIFVFCLVALVCYRQEDDADPYKKISLIRAGGCVFAVIGTAIGFIEWVQGRDVRELGRWLFLPPGGLLVVLIAYIILRVVRGDAAAATAPVAPINPTEWNVVLRRIQDLEARPLAAPAARPAAASSPAQTESIPPPPVKFPVK